MRKITFVAGTRPDTIKLAPVVKIFKDDSAFRTFLIVTAQHRHLLDQVLDVFSLSPDVDLNIMTENQDLFYISTKALSGFKSVFREIQPDMVIIQGDTTTAFITALSAFYEKIPVAHIEAGLRSFDRYNPFPEEMNRLLADNLSTILFPPTKRAKENLLREGLKQNIYITGNTGVDAVLEAIKHTDNHIPDKRLILVTCHRRESFGQPIREICRALRDITNNFKDVEIVYPVHPNPNVRNAVNELLKGSDRIKVIEPPDYLGFIKLMKNSYLILTDSGGLQEEAPSLGKPVLVMRDVTERMEGIEKGTAILVGRKREKILELTSKLLQDTSLYNSMKDKENPYGDGKASMRIHSYIRNYFGLPYEELAEFES